MTPGPPPSGKLSRRLDTHGEFPPDAIPAPEMSLSVLSDLRPLGQIHESFIIAAGRDGLWIIDQHVAHERILFEQVLKQRAAGRVEMQRLLMPMILQLTPEQQIDYARIAEELHASGFETEPFGNRTIAVKAAPANVGPQDLERILFEILEIAENEMRSASLDDLRRNICASIACRAAIKINMRLDVDQDGVAAARARGHGLSDELPARTADRDALLHAGDIEGVPPDLILRVGGKRSLTVAARRQAAPASATRQARKHAPPRQLRQ